MLQSVFFFFYSLLWRIAKPLLKKHRRLREGYEERLVFKDNAYLGSWRELAGKENSPAIDVWIQAASGGEAYLTLELLKQAGEFVRDNPTSYPLYILCTSMTKQGMDVLSKGKAVFEQSWAEKNKNNPELLQKCPQITLCYFPFDDKKSMQKAFELARPKICILLETELWPHFMWFCKKNQSKLYIVNARMTEKTFNSYKKIKEVLASLYPDAIFATREQDRNFYQEIFPQSLCKSMHNMKFDSIYHDLLLQMQDNGKNPLLEFFALRTCVWLFASVREEEEGDLQKLVKILHEQKTKSAVVIAPRHVARFGEWKKALENAGLPVRYFTELAERKELITEKSLVIWDRFGDLKDLYGMADYIFVGGSLAPLGGQNFLEPLVYGLIPHTGIYLHNFLWTFEMPVTKILENDREVRQKNLAEENLLCMYKDIAMLTEIFCALPEKKLADKRKIQEKFRQWLVPLTGDAKRVMAGILDDCKKK